MKRILFFVGFVCLLSATDSKTIPAVKHTDYVPDEQTPIKIAEAIWLPIFGKSIYDERPFKAYLSGDV